MGNETVVQLLLEKGVDVNIAGVHLLLEKGGDLNISGVAGITMMHWLYLYQIAIEGAMSIGEDLLMIVLFLLEEILERDADINSVDDKYGTPPGAAAGGGHKESVSMLLKRGASVMRVGGWVPHRSRPALDAQPAQQDC
ncbi:hypothetical protein EV426DRAFT_711837 [Tirmania nivea]|nr:hypothetical protein EV426DRAFT_711837 [Tirmania nivea]